jgi:hypothetical protein
VPPWPSSRRTAARYGLRMDADSIPGMIRVFATNPSLRVPRHPS